MAKLPPLVVVEWLDSAQPIPGWSHLDNLPEMEVIKCVSVGWLVGEKEGVKMLAQNVGDLGTHNAQASGLIRIPSISVVRQKKLDW